MRGSYKVKRNPKDRKWYAVGYIAMWGGGYWIPVSTGYAKRADAEQYAEAQPKAEAAARREIQRWKING